VARTGPGVVSQGTGSVVPAKRIEVVLCVTLNGFLDPDWFQHFTKVKLLGPDFHVEVMTTRGFLADSARNMAVWYFLKHTTAEYLLFMDADNVLPPEVVPQLLSRKKDICCGLYVMKDRPFPPVMYSYYRRGNADGFGNLYSSILEWERGAHFKVDAAGTGCMMIHRRVFEKIKPPWFSFLKGGTEDTYFCRLAQAAGYDIWMDTMIECGHSRTAVVTIDDYLAQYNKHGKAGLLGMMVTGKEAQPWNYTEEEIADEGEFGEVLGGVEGTV
jgi:glycosyltransferase involved in cell wall biosynthesis